MDLLSTDGQGHQQQQQGIGGDRGHGMSGSASGGAGMMTTSDGIMSKPSLISSLWSIQVQNEGSASDFPMGDCGSQQSLPELLNQASSTHCNGFAGVGAIGGGGGEQIHFDLGGGEGGLIPVPMDQQQPGTAMMASNTPAGMLMMMPCSAATMANNSSSLRPVKSLSDLHTLTAAQIAQTAAAMPCHHYHNNVPSNEQIYQGTFRRQTETGGTFYNMLSKQQRDFQICEWLQKLNVTGGGGGAENNGSESPSQEFYPQHRPPFHRADTTEQ